MSVKPLNNVVVDGFYTLVSSYNPNSVRKISTDGEFMIEVSPDKEKYVLAARTPGANAILKNRKDYDERRESSDINKIVEFYNELF
jgi:hypothetical protein